MDRFPIVGDLVEQARFLAIEVVCHDVEVTHAGRRLRQLAIKVPLGKNGRDHRIAVAGLCVASGAVALEEGIGSARR